MRTGGLPDDVKPSDIGNPYGDDPNPEPEGYCPHCREPYGKYINYLVSRHVNLENDGLRRVVLSICQECDEVAKARLVDETESFLSAWRNAPDMMAQSIDSYSELREITEGDGR